MSWRKKYYSHLQKALSPFLRSSPKKGRKEGGRRHIFRRNPIGKTGGTISGHMGKAISRLQDSRGGKKIIYLLRRLRVRTRPKRLNRDYRHFLHMTQEMLYDRVLEKHFFYPTRGHVELASLDIKGPNRRHGRDYYPIHRLSFDWAMAQLPKNLEHFTFIDYGAGKGRAMALAAMHPFRQITGIEFARQLHDAMQMNMAQFPRSLMKCRNIDCLWLDCADFTPPDGKLVCLINNSFDDHMLEKILGRLAASYSQHPRPIYLIMVTPPGRSLPDELIRRFAIFEPVYTSHSEKARLQLLSPDEVVIYKTLI